MELTLRQLAQLLDDPQESRDRRGLARVDLGAKQFLGLLQTRDLQKRVVVGRVAFASREFLGDDLLNAADAQPFGFRDLPQTATVHHRSVDMANAFGFFARRCRLDVRVGHDGASDEGREITMYQQFLFPERKMHFFGFAVGNEAGMSMAAGNRSAIPSDRYGDPPVAALALENHRGDRAMEERGGGADRAAAATGSRAPAERKRPRFVGRRPSPPLVMPGLEPGIQAAPSVIIRGCWPGCTSQSPDQVR